MLLRMEDLIYTYQKELKCSVSGKVYNKLRKLKAQRLRWATAWRRLHKKIKQTETGKLKRKRDDKR